MSFKLKCLAHANHKNVFIGDEELNFDAEGVTTVKSKTLALDILELKGWSAADAETRKALGLNEELVAEPGPKDDKPSKIISSKDEDPAVAAHREAIRRDMEAKGVKAGKIDIEKKQPSASSTYAKFDYPELRKFALDSLAGEPIPKNVRSKQELVAFLQSKGI